MHSSSDRHPPQATVEHHSAATFAVPCGRLALAITALLVLATTHARAASAETTCLVGATVHPVVDEPFEGTVCFRDAHITLVARGTDTPDGATHVDARGHVVTPGFIEVQSRLGLVEVNADTFSRDTDAGGDDPIRATFHARDSFNPASSLIPITRDGGITSATALPDGGLVSGRGALFDLIDGTVDEMLVPNTEIFVMQLGYRGGNAASTSRGGALGMIRELLSDTREYADRRQAYDDGAMRDLSSTRGNLEATVAVLDRTATVFVQVHRASDILLTLELAESFGLDLVLVGATEGWRVASEIAAAGVPVIVHPLVNLPPTLEAVHADERNAAWLAEAGAHVVLTSQDTHNARNLRTIAGNAVRAGLPWDAALRSITWDAARALGIGDTHGALALGHVANIVVWSGDPLEFSSQALRVYVRGREVTTRHRQDDLLDRYRVR